MKKIIEEHGGTLSLEDAPAFGEDGRQGAMAVIRLPLIAATDMGQNDPLEQAV